MQPPFLRTPHFDALCTRGIRFSSAYTACPTCVPARISMLTGRSTFAGRGGILSRQPTVRPDEVTMPGVLGGLGYQTALIGKFHVGQAQVRYGFDEITTPDVYYRQMERSGHPLQPMRHGLGQNELVPGMSTVPEALTLTSWIAERCVDFIRYRRDPSTPFFLWCSFPKPHPPLDPPEPYYSMYRNCAIPEPVMGDWARGENVPHAFARFARMQGYGRLTPEVIREARSAYYGLITQNDFNMGRILAILTDLDLLKDTLIVYTSDHGEYLGDHGAGAKSFFHEPSAHVPLVVCPPRSWQEQKMLVGTVCPTAVTHIDLMPTFIRAAGGEPPAPCEGIDLLALASGQIPNPRKYVEGMEAQNQYWFGNFAPCDYLALTDGRWKYIYYVEAGQEQLFDLQADPTELHDLANVPEHAARRQELRAELTRRQIERKTDAVKDGNLVAVKPLEVDDRVVRSMSWMGWHSEVAIGDIRH
jgi:arylsulfatase A-like enzyme